MSFQDNYIRYLNQLDKDACIQALIEQLDTKKINLDQAYQTISSALALTVPSDNHDVWQEHAKTQIVRTSLEVLTPYLLREVPKTNGKRIAVICPEGEYHELGPRLVSDWIRKLGYDALYLGNSLPNHELIKLVDEGNFNALAMSVSNFYTLSAVNSVIAQINERKPMLPILLGGLAISHNPDQIHGTNVCLCHTMQDLERHLGELK